MAEQDQVPSGEQSRSQAEKGFVGKRVDAVKQWWQDLRIGDGHAAAMGRLGLKELAQALPAFPESTIRPVEEPGLYGNPTQIMVTDEMGYRQPPEGHADHRTNEQKPERDKGRSR